MTDFNFDLNRPTSLFVEITSHCNMHCTFCPSDDLVRAKNHVNEEHARQFLEAARIFAPGKSFMLNVLGEPFLNKKLFDYIDVMEETGTLAGVITNMTLLDQANLTKLFSHSNVFLVMSLHTPTDQSLATRGYKKIPTYREYLGKACDAIEAKFRMGSKAGIHLYLATELMENLMQTDGAARLWTLFDDDKEYMNGMDYTIRQLSELAERLRREYPAFYQSEHDRAVLRYAKDLESGDIVLDPTQLPAQRHEWEKSGWMFLPDVILRRKGFGLWAHHKPFIRKHLPKGQFFFNEERTEPFQCIGTQAFGMLSNGEYSLCCQDVEGEMAIGNIKTMDPISAFHSERRKEIVGNSATSRVCRTCSGISMIFDTTPLSSETQTIDKFGSGWHCVELGLMGRPSGRWTAGIANTYFYSRLEAEELQIEFASTFPQDTKFRLLLSLYDAASQTFCSTKAVDFYGEHHGFARLCLPVSLKPSAFYRLKLLTPTWLPDVSTGDVRRLGIAVTDMRLVGQPYKEVAGDPLATTVGLAGLNPAAIPLQASPFNVLSQ